LILIDDCARFVTGHGVDDAERAEMVITTFEEAIARHGRPEYVMNDGGSASCTISRAMPMASRFPTASTM
jgi:transposase InsO family protein